MKDERLVVASVTRDAELPHQSSHRAVEAEAAQMARNASADTADMMREISASISLRAERNLG